MGPRLSNIGQLTAPLKAVFMSVGLVNGTFRWFLSVVAAPAARFSFQVSAVAAVASPTSTSVNKVDRIIFYFLTI
jgi:hypothetical protein